MLEADPKAKFVGNEVMLLSKLSANACYKHNADNPVTDPLFEGTSMAGGGRPVYVLKQRGCHFFQRNSK